MTERKKEYQRRYSLENRERLYKQDATRRAKLSAYVRSIKKRSPCTDCNQFFSDYPEVLEFDHVGTDKSSAVARLVSQGVSQDRIDLEISKCELVCANCHRIRTITRLGEARSISPVS